MTGPQDWDAYPDDAPEVVAVGGDLAPGTIVAAYRAGVFPWPPGTLGDRLRLRHRYLAEIRAGRIWHRGPPGWALPWFSPQPRAVLVPEQLHVARSLRSTLRQRAWTLTVDTVFDEVLTGCADRPDAWITPRLAAGYSALYAAGHAHSIEVWSADNLIGGLYGVAVGRVFCGESMFHRVPDASKVALLDLALRWRQAGGLLIDCQTPSQHLIALGQQLVSREDYRSFLQAVRDDPIPLPTGRAACTRLLTR